MQSQLNIVSNHIIILASLKYYHLNIFSSENPDLVTSTRLCFGWSKHEMKMEDRKSVV